MICGWLAPISSDAVSAVSAPPAHMLPRRVIHAPPIIRSSTRTDADTASQEATTATGAAITAAERAREAEGYAGAAQDVYKRQV